MSAHLASNGDLDTAGVVYVLYGGPELPSQIDLASPPDGVVRILGASPGDLLANSMAIADTDGDGRNELVLGANFADPEGRSTAGVAYVLDPARLEASTAVEGAALLERIDGAAAGDRTGANVATADFDGDGRREIILIAESAAGPGADRPEVGRIYVVKR
jgi:hypothetical protein